MERKQTKLDWAQCRPWQGTWSSYPRLVVRSHFLVVKCRLKQLLMDIEKFVSKQRDFLNDCKVSINMITLQFVDFVVLDFISKVDCSCWSVVLGRSLWHDLFKTTYVRSTPCVDTANKTPHHRSIIYMFNQMAYQLLYLSCCKFWIYWVGNTKFTSCIFWIYWVGVNTKFTICHVVNVVFAPIQ